MSQPIPIRLACSSRPAPIAAFARNTAAAIIPRRAPRLRSCRCCAEEEFRVAHRVRSPADQYGKTGKRATGVVYIDAQGEEFEQPAEMMSCAPTHYTICGCCCCRASAHLMTRRPDKAWSARTTPTRSLRVDVFFDDKIINPFVGAGALGIVIDDFNGDNFDHTGLGFIGGGISPAGIPTAGRSRPIPTQATRRNGAANGSAPSRRII